MPAREDNVSTSTSSSRTVFCRFATRDAFEDNVSTPTSSSRTENEAAKAAGGREGLADLEISSRRRRNFVVGGQAFPNGSSVKHSQCKKNFAVNQKNCIFAVPLRYGVMVALQILALSVRVRVLLSQQKREQAFACSLFYIISLGLPYFPTIATAQTSQPSPRPTKPRRSVVVALTLTASTDTPQTPASTPRISST